MKKKNKKIKRKFNYGGIVMDFLGGLTSIGQTNQPTPRYRRGLHNPGRVANPYETLQQNDIAKARAMHESENHIAPQILDLLGGTAMQVGSQMMGGGGKSGGSQMKGNAEKFPYISNPQKEGMNYLDMQDYLDYANQMNQIAALGGQVGSLPVEVEGGEVGETPMGDLIDFQGPTHEQGGIDANLPVGTNIFSDRIKIDGVSMADRKKKREKKEAYLEKKLEKNLYDTLTNNALKRTMETNSLEEKFDQNLQEEAGRVLGNGGQRPQYKTGTGRYGIGVDEEIAKKYGLSFTEGFEEDSKNIQKRDPSKEKSNWRESLGRVSQEGYKALGTPTGGDLLGMLGNFQQGRAGIRTTLQHRAGDTPNINPYENFGEDALRTLNESKALQRQIKDSRIANLSSKRASQAARNRNSAQGINTMRAMDIASDEVLGNMESQIMNEYLNSINAIIQNQAQTELNVDQTRMQGEAMRDDNDRKDRAAFFSNLAQDRKSLAQALTHTAKSMNKMKERQVNANFLNNTTEYVHADIMSGEITLREGISETVGKEDKTALFNMHEGWRELGYTKEMWDELSKSKQWQIILNWQKKSE